MSYKIIKLNIKSHRESTNVYLALKNCNLRSTDFSRNSNNVPAYRMKAGFFLSFFGGGRGRVVGEREEGREC